MKNLSTTGNDTNLHLIIAILWMHYQQIFDSKG